MKQKTKIQGGLLFTLVGIIFMSVNLRAPLTSISPVVYEIIGDLGLNNFQAGLITTLPLLAFGLFSIFVPSFGERFGLEKALWYSMPVLILGLFLRTTGSISFLLIGATIIGIAITIGNVLMPAFIKLRFPDKMGLMTGINALFMNVAGVLASGYSVKIGLLTGVGWKGSIGIWIIPAVVGFLFWIPQLKFNAVSVKSEQTKRQGFAELLRSRQAWYVTIFMGLQSCLFYILVAWLPMVLQDWGMTKEQAGWTFSYIQMTQLPITLIGPILTARIKNHNLLIIFTSVITLLGVCGLILFKTTFVIPSVICLGVGTGLAFSIVLMFFVMKTETAQQAGQLSGMAQSFGYLIAAASPPLFGFIYDKSGDWRYALLLFVPITMVLCIVGVLSSAKKHQRVS